MKYFFLFFMLLSSIGYAETSLRINAQDTIYEEIFIWICEGDTYYFDGNPLTSSGVYTATFEASNGMDSVVTLYLLFFTAPYVYITGPFCEGDTIEILGQYYWEEGDYTFIHYYGDSCEQEVSFSIEWMDINTEVVQIGNTLIAQNTDPIYQWFDCNTDMPIPGAIQSSFTPTVNGSYKVRLTTIEGCVAFSDCYEVSTVAVENITNDIKWSIYPNPVNDYLEISVQGETNDFHILIYDMLGHRLMEKTFSNGNNKEKINVKELPPGTYTVKLNNHLSSLASKFFIKI